MSDLDDEDFKVRAPYVQKILELEEQLAAVTKERDEALAKIERLEAWKAEAIAVMPDMQAIGKLIGVKLGDTIHDKIIPAIKELTLHDQQVLDEAYEKGRKDMHDAVMTEWNKPAQVGNAHIGDRLRNLKGTA